MQFGYSSELTAVNSQLSEGDLGSVEVLASDSRLDHFGIAYLVPFYSGCSTSIELTISPKSSTYFRIEASGFTSRMQKAYLEFDHLGKIQVLGEEIQDCSIDLDANNQLNIFIKFTPYRTNRSHLFIFSKNLSIDSKEVDFRFLCSPLMLDFKIDQAKNQENVSRQETNFGTLVAINGLYQFRNYLHLEFEMHRPNATLCGLQLISPVPLETIQWWTNNQIDAEVRLKDQSLKPQPTRYPLPSPMLMTLLGPEFSFQGHQINALYATFQDEKDNDQLPPEKLIEELQLEAYFNDGTIELISLASSQRDKFLELSYEFKFIEEYFKNKDWPSKPIFCEIGARGLRSAGIRKKVDHRFKYIGIDISPHQNVNIVGDAHQLSRLVEPDSIDVIYSDDVIEHLNNPIAFISEANEVLKQGGLFIAKVPTTWPLHAEPWDYWRMSVHSWNGLLNQTTGFEILSAREIGSAVIVPSAITPDISVRMQYAPAPLFTVVVAKKFATKSKIVGESTNLNNLGSYDHWSLKS